MKLQWLLFLLFCGRNSSTPVCNNKGRCRCYGESELELQCPTEVEDDVIIHIREDEIKIGCPPNLEFFKLSYLPNIKASEAESLRVRFCPLPQKPFRRLFSFFSLSQVTYFEISVSNMKNQTITAHKFEGFEELIELKMADNYNVNLDSNVFMNTPRLKALELQNNSISLEPDLFKHLQELEFLDLSVNKIQNLPKHIFSPLKMLERLHLWDNKLKEVDDYTFRELRNLKSLELRINQIENISENAFRPLKNLTQIDISGNRMRNLPQDLFRHNKQLQLVWITHNYVSLELPDYLFANLFLKEVDLTNSYLKVLPEHLFENTTSLTILKLGNNKIRHLPETLFRGLPKLIQLRLQHNQIESISKIFSGLTQLRYIYLQNNLIEVVDETTFADLVNLKRINLKGNRIQKIGDLFHNHIHLISVNLSFNRLLDSAITLEKAHHLSVLDLSHNNISIVKLKNIKVASNVLIRLDYNHINFVDFTGVVSGQNLANSTISLSNNPINCDCHNYELVKFLNQKPVPFEISTNNLTCSTPLELKNKPLDKLPLTLTCPINNSACPEECSCEWRPWDKSIVINCTRSNLKKFPNLNLTQFDYPFNQTEMHLEGNLLEEGPPNLPVYNNVTKLFLSRNKIRKLEWLPPTCEYLLIDNNQISSLDPEILTKLNKSKVISLENNPWICDCNSKVLVDFLRQEKNPVNNTNLFCVNSGLRLIDLKESDLCYSLLPYTILIKVSIILIITILLAVYFRHKEKIKLWLYTKNVCTHIISEENLDSNKIYDIFISYSHKDEDFVARTLLPVLENDPHPYKLCLHYRNWIPGEFISKQITDSVLQSRRTLIVLSQNYLDSPWAKMEYRTAHTQALSDGCPRVIVVLYGDVDEDSLDENLKIYLKTNTYVKWGDAYFWDKLRKALPKHRKNRTRGKKPASFSPVDDENCRLIYSTATSPGTTPPVESMTFESLNF